MFRNPLLLAALAALSVDASAITLAKYPLVLTTDKDVQVVIAPSVGADEALVRVKGVNDPIDGVVFLSRVQKDDRGLEIYQAELDGRSFPLVEKTGDQGVVRYRLNLGYREGRSRRPVGSEDLSFDMLTDDRKGRGNPVKELEAAYAKQVAQGVQARLAKFDREKNQARQLAALAKTDQQASASCGSPVKTTVNWSSFTDAEVRDVARHCETVAQEMDVLCSGDAFKKQVPNLGRVECRQGPAQKLRNEGGKLVFTVDPQESGDHTFVRNILLNQ